MATPQAKQVFGYLLTGALCGAAASAGFIGANAATSEDRIACGATIAIPQTKADFDAIAKLTPDEQKALRDQVAAEGADQARSFVLEQTVTQALDAGKTITINSVDKQKNCFNITLR